MKNVFNKKELVGQKVHCHMGNGYISEVTDDLKYPVIVEIGDEYRAFTQDGKYMVQDVSPCLRFGHTNPEEFDYGTPVFTPKLLELNYVYVDCWVTEDRSVFEKGLQYTEAKIVAKHENGYFLDSEGFNWKYAWAKS